MRVELADVGVAYNESAVFQGVSLRLAPGETLAVVGPTGSGKTTFLKLCAGLLPPARGTVVLDGQDPASLDSEGLSRLRRRIRFVAQEGALISNLSIFENLALPMRYHSHAPEEVIRREVEGLLAEAAVKFETILGMVRRWRARKATMVLVTNHPWIVRDMADRLIALLPDGVHWIGCAAEIPAGVHPFLDGIRRRLEGTPSVDRAPAGGTGRKSG
ncbi:MAG: ATP-binding cassette domain-containing protein [Nitrospirae bacterium]|nr:ATP-binding cassette domain-containing protein [Nitrospirota bacterium]